MPVLLAIRVYSGTQRCPGGAQRLGPVRLVRGDGLEGQPGDAAVTEVGEMHAVIGAQPPLHPIRPGEGSAELAARVAGRVPARHPERAAGPGTAFLDLVQGAGEAGEARLPHV